MFPSTLTREVEWVLMGRPGGYDFSKSRICSDPPLLGGTSSHCPFPVLGPLSPPPPQQPQGSG